MKYFKLNYSPTFGLLFLPLLCERPLWQKQGVHAEL